jgi:hypothetical protein
MAAVIKKKVNKRVIKVNFEGVETKTLVPEGDYIIKPIEAEREVGEDSGKEYIAWVFEVVDGKYKGQKLYDNTSLQEQALWKLKGLLDALGMEGTDSAMELNLDDIIEAEPTCRATVEHEKQEGFRTRAKIVEYLPADGGGAEDSTEEQEISEEDILKMDEDDLEAIIKDNKLDVDLNEHKTIKAKRQAVIEALSGEEGEEPTEEEESTEEEEGEEPTEEEEAADIDNMGKEELAEFVKEHKLKVKLIGTTAKQRATVKKAAVEAGLIEESE